MNCANIAAGSTVSDTVATAVTQFRQLLANLIDYDIPRHKLDELLAASDNLINITQKLATSLESKPSAEEEEEEADAEHARSLVFNESTSESLTAAAERQIADEEFAGKMIIKIKVLDDEDVVHGSISANMPENATVDMLRAAIDKALGWDECYQQLFHKGRQFFDGNLTQLGIEHDDTIIVKHLHLNLFRAYVSLVEGLDQEPGFAWHAHKQEMRLLESEFFENYNFGKEFVDCYRKIANCLKTCPQKTTSEEYVQHMAGLNISNAADDDC